MPRSIWKFHGGSVGVRDSRAVENDGPAGSRPRWLLSGNFDRFVPDTRFGTDCRSAVRPLRPGDSWFDGARQALSNHLSAV